MKNKNIYVVLIKAMTGLGVFARKIFKYPYTHIAVCLDEELEDFVTFSRRKHFAPFDAGFMHEKREHYAFGKYKTFQAKVFKIPVIEENYEKIKAYVGQIENDEEYIFNIFSMVTMGLFHGVRIYKALNCMSFTAKIIELSEVTKLNRQYHKYNIKEMDELLKDYLWKEEEFRKNTDDEEYMSRKVWLKNIGLYFKLNGQILFRMLFKSRSKFD